VDSVLPEKGEILDHDRVADPGAGHFVKLGNGIVGLALQPDITGIAGKERDVGDIIEQHQFVTGVEPGVGAYRPDAAAGGAVFDIAAGKVDAKNG
jgi:hypothetical protein